MFFFNPGVVVFRRYHSAKLLGLFFAYPLEGIPPRRPRMVDRKAYTKKCARRRAGEFSGSLNSFVVERSFKCVMFRRKFRGFLPKLSEIADDCPEFVYLSELFRKHSES